MGKKPQVSSGQNPGWLGYIGDYIHYPGIVGIMISQLSAESLLTNQEFMEFHVLFWGFDRCSVQKRPEKTSVFLLEEIRVWELKTSGKPRLLETLLNKRQT